ncbi:DUF6042 family protein [Streptomyces sp. NBC_00102]|uniref:DUF6042 family protein n=1 Tax=Streptomyces sp. NBC_00102 TaxID=2975652 RepID=UPI0022503CAE|nr:DUF6042 family protein [Streptomyces sp. NBC_00102]MCX5395676.1 DUF6042 family protein [Streptomyces sp. NBC_00102]
MSDTTTAQNTNAGDDSLSMHTGWWSSGWGHVLPQHQGMLLCMVLGTATVRKVEGDFDEVVQQIVGDSREGLFRLLGDDLNAPVMWLDEEELESAESDEEREEIRISAAENEATLTGALRAAGMPVPTTVRELVKTMLDLKLVAYEDGVWSMPEEFSLPEDTLTLSEPVLARLRKMRHYAYTEPADQGIVRHLIDDLDYPVEVFTSLDRLVSITGEDLEKVRAALEQLVETGDAQLYRGDPRVVVAAKDLLAHQRFYLVPDWETSNENRLMIRRVD